MNGGGTILHPNSHSKKYIVPAEFALLVLLYRSIVCGYLGNYQDC